MKVRIPESILVQAVADETVILNPDTGVYFTLDAVGTRMLALMRELGDAQAAAEQVVFEYDTDVETARRDLDALLAKMAEHGLAEQVDG